MSPEEALQICRLAKAAFPQQAVDEFTPDAWALALEDDRFEDAKLALKQLMREQPFLHVSELIGRMKRIRRNRLDAFGTLPEPPVGVGESPEKYRDWYAETVRAIGDGDLMNHRAIGSARKPDINYATILPSVDA